jgi:hypothetical protein
MAEPPEDAKGRWLIALFIAAYLNLHLRRYRRLRPFTDEGLAAWKLPMVARRLVRDNILPEERRRMMDYIDRALDGQASTHRSQA